MTKKTLIKNGLIYPANDSADMLIGDGVIEHVAASIDAPQDDIEILDATGCIVTPGLIEAHCHLDKTLWGGPWVADRGAANIAERIALKERNTEYGLPSEQYATALLRQWWLAERPMCAHIRT